MRRFTNTYNPDGPQKRREARASDVLRADSYAAKEEGNAS